MSHRKVRSVDEALFRALLRQARWKRLIVGMSLLLIGCPRLIGTDEGSIASHKDTKFVRLISELDFERKWLVSGSESSTIQNSGRTLTIFEAPTPNLQQGVDFGGLGVLHPPGPSVTASTSTQSNAKRKAVAEKFRVDAKAFGNMLCNFVEASFFPNTSRTSQRRLSIPSSARKVRRWVRWRECRI